MKSVLSKALGAMAAAAAFISTPFADAATCGGATCHDCTCTGNLEQSNGCPIPQFPTAYPSCKGNVQGCLDQEEGVGVIDACTEGSTGPETFVPACALT